jgi:hypothetical protein
MEADSSRRRRFWAFSIVGFLLIVSAWYYATNVMYMYIVAYAWFGFTYGVLQQWGRFCFASAWRDLLALRVTRMYIGIMIALVILAVVIAFLETKNLSTFHPAPLGWHELLGGLIFGLGMVLAGGCATGTLYKTGEGNLSSATTLVAMMFSQALFVDIGGYFDRFLRGYTFKQPTHRISDSFSQLGDGKYFVGDVLINSLLVVAILLILTYILVTRKDILEQKAMADTTAADGGSVKMSFKEDLAGFWGMLTASKRTTIAGALIGIVAGLNILVIQGLRDRFAIDNFGGALLRMGFTEDVSRTGKVFDPGYWYITSQEAQFGAWILEKLGMNMRDNIFFGVTNAIPQPLHNPLLWMSFGLMLGAAAMSLLSNEFKWKKPNRELFTFAIIGGTLMGIGARIALGCNIGGFYIRAAGGDPGGWVFFLGMGGGAFLAVKAMSWWTERQMGKMDFDLEIE